MHFGLVELIEQLKRELGELQLSESHLFTIEGVDLELKFVVEKTIGASGKARWVLFAAEAKGQYKDQQVNTIKLALRPMRDELGFSMIEAEDDEPPPPEPSPELHSLRKKRK